MAGRKDQEARDDLDPDVGYQKGIVANEILKLAKRLEEFLKAEPESKFFASAQKKDEDTRAVAMSSKAWLDSVRETIIFRVVNWGELREAVAEARAALKSFAERVEAHEGVKPGEKGKALKEGKNPAIAIHNEFVGVADTYLKGVIATVLKKESSEPKRGHDDHP